MLRKVLTIYLLFFSLLLCYSCGRQIQLGSGYYLTRKDLVFDIKRFEIREKAGIAEYSLADGTKVRETKFNNTGAILSQSFKQGSAVVEIKDYYPNLKLKRVQLFLNGLSVGMSYAYDQNGKLSKSVNYDHLFKLSVQDLISMVKTKYQIDLNIEQNGLVVISQGAANDGTSPQYSMDIQLPDRRHRVIIIDGDTGAILKDFMTGPSIE